MVEALPRVLDSLDRSVAQARLALAAAEAERASTERGAHRAAPGGVGLRERLQAITESVHGLELQIYEKKLHLSSLLERVQSELGPGRGHLVAEYGPDQLGPATIRGRAGRGRAGRRARRAIPFDRASSQQRRLQEAERKLAQLGRVNPLALEEFAALEQRHKFLTEQLADLTNTRKDLLTIIDGDRRADADHLRVRLRGHRGRRSARCSRCCSPAAAGSISLTNPDDLLNTGIEVAVRPAGKKIERLSLLSGGERSLAAVALLVAIFKARPSPFYIMDEVEAALDDANLGRLLTVFEQLRASSQLIVITHQKRTMEIADALYGVSMRQDGVSAVVGQRVGDRAAAAV